MRRKADHFEDAVAGRVGPLADANYVLTGIGEPVEPAEGPGPAAGLQSLTIVKLRRSSSATRAGRVFGCPVSVIERKGWKDGDYFTVEEYPDRLVYRRVPGARGLGDDSMRKPADRKKRA